MSRVGWPVWGIGAVIVVAAAFGVGYALWPAVVRCPIFSSTVPAEPPECARLLEQLAQESHLRAGVVLAVGVGVALALVAGMWKRTGGLRLRVLQVTLLAVWAAIVLLALAFFTPAPSLSNYID